MTVSKTLADTNKSAANQSYAVWVMAFLGDDRFTTESLRRTFFNQLLVGSVPVKIAVGFETRRFLDLIQMGLIADVLNRNGVPDENITFLALLAAPEGLARFRQSHPGIPIYLAAVDERLDEHDYIVPGIGDAGDRLFGAG